MCLKIVKILGVRGLGETGKNYAIDKAIEALYGEFEENYIHINITYKQTYFNRQFVFIYIK